MLKKLLLILSCALFSPPGFAVDSSVGNICVPVGRWLTNLGAGNQAVPTTQFMTGLAQQPVVLLGETHDSFEHHRWQLQTISALHAQRPDMVLGFEMFPLRVQPALDRWVAGELTEQEFLEQSEWAEVWNYDPALYLPIFHFARMNRVPMLALNVDRQLTSLVREKGWEAVPEEMRAGISDPAPPSQAYLDFLSQAFQAHRPQASGDGPAVDFDFSDLEFHRFVQSQQVWDRTMAEAIASVAQKPAPPLVIGIMGAGHIMNRFGVPHQLDDLGTPNVAVLLPWDVERECNELTSDLADGVFGVSAPMEVAQHKPRLGLIIEKTDQGIEVKQLQQGGIAEAAGIRVQDIIIEIAGIRIEDANEVSEIVQRQAPGTWLPIKLKRGTHEMEVIAKFPVQQ